ncbi:unnamed protein product [Leptidea sinapis]|uniref:Uncharacterized protein n=1 Tax=Leptidea sinapis TaxID=189913 RepID=A0A5E4QUH7_9NEOP|nr:unnamed protein product [Leptidea sinapis]
MTSHQLQRCLVSAGHT